jgi:hypothetical protein
MYQFLQSGFVGQVCEVVDQEPEAAGYSPLRLLQPGAQVHRGGLHTLLLYQGGFCSVHRKG